MRLRREEAIRVGKFAVKSQRRSGDRLPSEKIDVALLGHSLGFGSIADQRAHLGKRQTVQLELVAILKATQRQNSAEAKQRDARFPILRRWLRHGVHVVRWRFSECRL